MNNAVNILFFNITILAQLQGFFSKLDNIAPVSWIRSTFLFLNVSMIYLFQITLFVKIIFATQNIHLTGLSEFVTFAMIINKKVLNKNRETY